MSERHLKDVKVTSMISGVGEELTNAFRGQNTFQREKIFSQVKIVSCRIDVLMTFF